MITSVKDLKPYTMRKNDVLEKLETSKKGLTDEQIKERQAIFPKNELIGKEPPSIWEIFFSQFKDLLIIILIFAAIISVLLSEEHGAGRFQDAIVILIILIVNAIFGTRQEWKADKAIQALQSMTSLKCHVIRNGILQEIETKELLPGDIIRLEAGDIIPADARLIENVNLKTVESALTGESSDVNKFANDVFPEDTHVAERINTVFKGTHVSFGRGLAVVTATGMDTEFGKIANLVSDLADDTTPIQEQLDTLGRQLGLITIAICLGVIALGTLAGGEIGAMLLMGVSLAVAAIPEGLPIVVTLAMAIGVQKMAKRHAIVRKLPAVESLGAASVICTDKTGTLTLNKMTVRRMACFTSKDTLDIYDPAALTETTDNLDLLFRSGVLCNNASLKIGPNGNKIEVGDPTETALLRVAHVAGYNLEQMEKRFLKRDEIPFDSERKRMSTVHEDMHGENLLSYTKGAPDVLLELCTGYLVGEKIHPIDQEARAKITSVLEALADDALRVLAFAWKPMEKGRMVWNINEMDQDMVFIGLMGLIDPPKPEVFDAVKACQSAGVQIKMVTGDHKRTAAAIGKQLNILEIEDHIITGKELDQISDQQLKETVMDYTIFARISPAHKLRIVQAIKSNNRVVAMTGDGVNDAPALKAADIGVAMGINGTDVTKETSDMVLTDDNFASIAAAIEEGRAVYQSMGKFLKYMMSSNSAEILVIALAILLGLPPPFVPIQILWINLVTDGLPALALGVDPPEPGLMERPPRDPNENILTMRMALFIARIGLYMTAICLGMYIYGLGGFNGNFEVTKVRASTMTLATLSIIQLFNSFGTRSIRTSVLGKEFLANKALLWATSISAFMQIFVIQGDFWIRSIFNNDFVFFTDIFKVTNLGIVDWITVIVAASSILLFEEFFKWRIRVKERHEEFNGVTA